jgi:hypothetical protein
MTCLPHVTILQVSYLGLAQSALAILEHLRSVLNFSIACHCSALCSCAGNQGNHCQFSSHLVTNTLFST